VLQHVADDAVVIDCVPAGTHAGTASWSLARVCGHVMPASSCSSSNVKRLPAAPEACLKQWYLSRHRHVGMAQYGPALRAQQTACLQVRARVKRHDFVGFASAPALPGQAKRMQVGARRAQLAQFAALEHAEFVAYVASVPGRRSAAGSAVSVTSWCSLPPAACSSIAASTWQILCMCVTALLMLMQ
jgi:hypothetical protein